MGGVVPFTEEILYEIQRITAEPLSVEASPRERWYERMVGLR
jgi:hypothetical protein